MRPRAGDDRTNALEPIDAAFQRLHGLEPQVAFRKMGVAARDVRRVRNDDIEARIAHCRVPVALDAPHVFSAKTLRVLARNRERIAGTIDGSHPRSRPLEGERDADATAARAEIENARLTVLGNP